MRTPEGRQRQSTPGVEGAAQVLDETDRGIAPLRARERQKVDGMAASSSICAGVERECGS